MTTAVVGRVSHVGHPDTDGAQWIYDRKRGYVAPTEVNQLERIGKAMQEVDVEQAGLIRAVRLARTHGHTWEKIAVALGVSRREAQRRFGFIDNELLPSAARQEPEQVVHDFSALKTMTAEEIRAEVAASMPPGGLKIQRKDTYRRGLLEAAIVTLHKRGMTHKEISSIVGRSHQRVSQIAAGFYDRQKLEWERQRAASREQKGD